MLVVAVVLTKDSKGRYLYDVITENGATEYYTEDTVPHSIIVWINYHDYTEDGNRTIFRR